VENPSFYLWIGLALGTVVGVGATVLYVRVRGLFARSEISRLRKENRSLKQRLEKKDKYIQEMLYHTEKIATGLTEQSKRRSTHGS
jgi:uncharacterized membrane-anchored protein YhcB (DUF1043 family)